MTLPTADPRNRCQRQTLSRSTQFSGGHQPRPRIGSTLSLPPLTHFHQSIERTTLRWRMTQPVGQGSHHLESHVGDPTSLPPRTPVIIAPSAIGVHPSETVTPQTSGPPVQFPPGGPNQPILMDVAGISWPVLVPDPVLREPPGPSAPPATLRRSRHRARPPTAAGRPTATESPPPPTPPRNN